MNSEALKHALSLMDRKQLTLSGVKDVVSFDETNVVLQTVCGMLSIEGQELHVQVMNTETGEVIEKRAAGLAFFNSEM